MWSGIFWEETLWFWGVLGGIIVVLWYFWEESLWFWGVLGEIIVFAGKVSNNKVYQADCVRDVRL